jgi:hypothetical protein
VVQYTKMRKIYQMNIKYICIPNGHEIH